MRTQRNRFRIFPMEGITQRIARCRPSARISMLLGGCVYFRLIIAPPKPQFTRSLSQQLYIYISCARINRITNFDEVLRIIHISKLFFLLYILNCDFACLNAI